MTLRERIAQLEETQARILEELGALRLRAQPRADARSCETLLQYLVDAFGSTPWTTAIVFDAILDNPLLRGAIIRCIGADLTIAKLSRFLNLHCGTWGDLQLRCINRHSREGARFTVTKSVTSSHKKRDSVQPH
jgi:hypothetical protein